MEQIIEYESPEMELILVDDSDVITLSLDGFGQGGGIDIDNPWGF